MTTNHYPAEHTMTWTDSTRGMRGKVRVRITDGDKVIVDDGRPFDTPAQARAYAMRWTYGGRKSGTPYTIQFAEAQS